MVLDPTNSPNNMVTELPENWNVNHFEDVAEIDKISLGANTPPDYAFEYISLSDVDSEEFFIEKSKQVFATAPSRARRIVKKGDVLMSTVRPNLLGFTLIKDDVKDLIASTGFAVISARHCSEEYIFQYLFCQHMAKQFHQLLTGSNYPALSSSDVRRLKIFLPPLEEQRAIARVLGTMDELISKTNRLIAQKELRKKWLMQNLLTAKKRLKGFAGEWKIVPLGDVLSPVSRPVEKPKTSFLALGIRSHGKGTFLKPDFEPEKIEIDTLFIVRENDLIVNITFAWEGAVAIVKKEDNGALVSHRFPTFTFKAGHGDVEFFRHFILQSRFKYMLDLISPGGAGRNRVLSKKDFLKLEVQIPKVEEQIAIGEVLQAADNEITLLKAKTEKLREQKKGLMQQLLTGKKRLKSEQ